MNSISYTYRFFALSMAILMFFTSVGFVLDMHYCQGQLKSINFLGKAKNCHEMAASMKGCPHHQQLAEQTNASACSMGQKGCCENKISHVQSQQDQELASSEFVLSKPLQQFVMAYVFTFFAEILLEKRISTFETYIPPLISRDIYVLFESFLL